MTPGIYNLSSDEYHRDPAPTASLSSSIASILLDQSPAHAWLAHPRLNPNFAREENGRFDIGTVAHTMLLERREDTIVWVDAPDWRTKNAREARDAARINGKHAILERYRAPLGEMVIRARAFIDTTELAGIFDTGDAEQTAIWQENDLWYRCKPDLLSADRRVILDYKTTESAAPDAFARQIGRMSYDLQSEFYTRGLFALTGTEPTFVFLDQEISEPYSCSLMALSNAYREVGRAKVTRAMSIWDRCVKSNNWPGYTNRILYAEPKPWDLIQADESTPTQEESE